MSGSGRSVLPDVREARPNVKKCSGGPPVCPGVVGNPQGCPGVAWRPSRVSGSGGVPSRMSGSYQEALSYVW